MLEGQHTGAIYVQLVRFIECVLLTHRIYVLSKHTQQNTVKCLYTAIVNLCHRFTIAVYRRLTH